MRSYIEAQVEIFDHASVPPEIAELLIDWPEIDSATARLVRAAVMSRDQRRLRYAWYLLAARAELVRATRPD